MSYATKVSAGAGEPRRWQQEAEQQEAEQQHPAADRELSPRISSRQAP